MYLRNIRSRNVYTPRRNFRASFDRKTQINGVFTYRRKERSLFLQTPIYEFFRVIRIENTVEDNKSGASKIVLYQM